MKQSNNAIKFLMAQYRAIYKHAYLKSLLSATALSATIITGVANANQIDFLDEGTIVNNPSDAIKGSYADAKDLTVNAQNKSYDLASGAQSFVKNVTIQSGGALTINISVGRDGRGLNTDNVTVNAGGTLAFSGSGDSKVVSVLGADYTDAADGKKLVTINSDLKITGFSSSIDKTKLEVKSAVSSFAGIDVKNATINLSSSGAESNLLAQGFGTSFLDGAEEPQYTAGDLTKAIATFENATVNINSGDTTDKLFTLGSLNDVLFKNSTIIAGQKAGIYAYNLDNNEQGLKFEKSKLTVNGTDAELRGSQIDFISGSTLDVQANASVSLNGLKDKVDALKFTNHTKADIKDAEFNVISSKVYNAGTINVHGQLKFDETSALVAKNNAAKLIIESDTNESGSLVLNEQQLAGYIKGTAETSASKGILGLSGAVVDLGTSNVNLSSYNFASGSGSDDATAAGTIYILGSGENTFKAKEITIEKALGSGGTPLSGADQKISLQAESLILGSDSLDASGSSAISFSGAKVGNITFKSSDTFNLKNAVTLSVDYDEDGKADITDNEAFISGNFNLVSGASFKVDEGNYTANGKMTITSGSLTVGSGSQTSSSYLALNALEIHQATSANSITIEGNEKYTSTLDLRNASGTDDFKVVADGTNKTTALNVNAYGNLLATGSQIENILADVTGKSGAGIFINDNGLVDVEGAVGSFSNRISVDKFKQDSGASSFTIAFSSGAGHVGTFKADSLFLLDNQSGDTKSLDIGAANILKLNTLNVSTHEEANTAFDIKSGQIYVNSGIEVGQFAKDLKLGASADLFLGSYDSGTQITTGGGSVATNLDLASGAKLSVYGDWVAKDFISSGADALFVGKTGSLEVNKFSAVTSGAEVYGSLSIAGLANSATESGTGVSLAANSVDIYGTVSLEAGVAEDIKFADKTSTEVQIDGITQSAFDLHGGTLKIAFNKDQSFSLEQLNSLKKYLFSNSANGLINGVLHIGAAQIGELTLDETKKEEGRYSITDISSVSGIEGTQVSNNQLTENSFYSQDGSDVAATIGSLHVKSSSPAQINKSAGFVNSATNQGFFVSTGSGENLKAANINFTGTQLSLKNGGKAGDISLGENSTLRIDAENAQQVAQLGNVSGGKVDLLGNTSATEVNVKQFTSSEGANLTAESFTVTGDALVKGSLNVTSGNAVFSNSAQIQGNTSVSSGTLELTKGGSINNNAVVKAKSIEIGDASSTVYIGHADEVDSSKDSSAFVETSRLDLNGGTLIADPSYGMKASVFVTDTLGNIADAKVQGGTLSGKLVAAQNSIIALGLSATESSSVEQKLNDIFLDKITDGSGQLSSDNIGSIVYVGKALSVKDGSKIVLDAHKSATSYNEALVKDATYQQDTQSDLYLGENTALVIDESSLGYKANERTLGAIHFAKNDASVQGNGGKILLAGASFNADDSVTLLTDNNGGVDIKGEAGIEVESLNGHYRTVLKAGDNTENVVLDFQAEKALSDYKGLSEPVIDTLMSYSTRDLNWDEQGEQGYEQALVHNGIAKGATVNEQGEVVINGQVAKNQKLYVVVANTDGSKTVYNAANNTFLQDITKSVAHGEDVETASRFAAFGGAAQAALLSSQNTNEVVAARMGMGGANSALSFADNGQGAGLFVAPMYKSYGSDGFKAQGVNYGVDVDLFGLALGGDYTMNNGLRLGLMFNIGSGDADGNGMAEGVNNDFDYYGIAMYAGFSQNNFSVVADASYSVVDNDVSSKIYTDKLSAKLDSTALSLGVTANYAIATSGLDITPHAGLRFTRIDMDDYTLKGDKYKDIAQVDSADLNVFSIPLGVSFAKEIVAGTWTVKPVLDLTLTANFGDDEVESQVNWIGTENLATKTHSEMLDSFTYGAALGVAAKSGNLSFGIGANYTGSSNTDEYGINANARFVF